MTHSPIKAPRLVLAGDSAAVAPLAHDLLEAGLGPVGILQRTLGAAADAAAFRPDRIVPLDPRADLSRTRLLLLPGGKTPDTALPAAAPGAVVVVAGAGSLRRAAKLHRSAGVEAGRLLATGGLACQLRLEGAVARRAGVSRSQVSALVLGHEEGSWLPILRHIRIAGIPAAAFSHLRLLENLPAGDGGADLLERRAAVLVADAVLRHRRKVLSCGALLPAGLGLLEGFRTFPAVIGASGVERHLPLVLTLEERAFLNGAPRAEGAQAGSQAGPAAGRRRSSEGSGAPGDS